MRTVFAILATFVLFASCGKRQNQGDVKSTYISKKSQGCSSGDAGVCDNYLFIKLKETLDKAGFGETGKQNRSRLEQEAFKQKSKFISFYEEELKTIEKYGDKVRKGKLNSEDWGSFLRGEVEDAYQIVRAASGSAKGDHPLAEIISGVLAESHVEVDQTKLDAAKKELLGSMKEDWAEMTTDIETDLVALEIDAKKAIKCLKSAKHSGGRITCSSVKESGLRLDGSGSTEYEIPPPHEQAVTGVVAFFNGLKFPSTVVKGVRDAFGDPVPGSAAANLPPQRTCPSIPGGGQAFQEAKSNGSVQEIGNGYIEARGGSSDAFVGPLVAAINCLRRNKYVSHAATNRISLRQAEAEFALSLQP